MEGRENIAVSISFICCGGEKLCRDEKREEGGLCEWNKRNEAKSER